MFKKPRFKLKNLRGLKTSKVMTQKIIAKTMENLLKRITINPDIAHGKPTIRNTRYAVSFILEYLAGGDTTEDLLKEFIDLEKEDILACLAYAAQTVNIKDFKISAA